MKDADFSGYASKNDLPCTDGRTIKSGAFKGNDKQKVPLVWSHSHNNASDVLGHAILENREDGVYAYGFFNASQKAQDAKIAVQHGDVEALSIFANNLVHQGHDVVHGIIREVSLVLAGANPGAFIDNVTIAHADGTFRELEDQAEIFMSAEDVALKHGADLEDEETKEEEAKTEPVEEENEDTEPSVQDVLESMTPRQQAVTHSLLNQALAHADGDTEAAEAEDTDTGETPQSIEEVVDSMDEEQRNVLFFLLGQIEDNDEDEEEENTDTDTESTSETNADAEETVQHSQLNQQEGSTMTANLFDKTKQTEKENSVNTPTLSHDAMGTIVSDAEGKFKSLKDSFISHAQDYGIEDIDILFPDAKTLYSTPDYLQRRNEWVADVLGSVRKSPFSRIKSIVADITADEARAKGYVKGTRKKDEIIKLLKRVTTPKTIYKKQKLDRDDIIDIVEIDVVVWLKQEMRLMLDEELARAILIGDGREADDEDKIDEDHIRPIASDDEMYVTQITVAPEQTPKDRVKSLIRSRTYYKGTGTPTAYMTDPLITDMLLDEDKMGRRLYDTVEQLAQALRVSKIVPVEVLESQPEILAIIVNLTDYTVGADQGGQISMFDDFDIDYNQQKYLIETRVSGALTKPKAAVVLRAAAGTIVTAQAPSYDASTHQITIPTQTGVVYSVDGADKAAGSKVQVEEGETAEVVARGAAGYALTPNSIRDWNYSY